MDTVIKAFLIYVFLWVVLRLTGRRTLGQLNIFEFILLLIVGGAVQRALTGQDYSLTNAFVLVITLLFLDVIVSLLEQRLELFGKITKGVATIVVENGRPMLQRMRRARLTEGEVMEAARHKHGLERIDQIKYAILETSGEISIIPGDRSGKLPAPAESPAKPPARKPRAPSVKKES